MTKFEKLFVWGSTAIVTVTGVVYTWMKYLLEPAEPWAVINHPLQPWVLKAHILTAPLLVFGIGMIVTRHIWPHFRAGVRKGRRSGIGTALVTIPMIVTGYLIQAVTHVGWLKAIALAHLALGLVYAVAAGIHWVATARRKRRPAAVTPAVAAPRLRRRHRPRRGARSVR